jgi:oligopeptide transport system permease protein
MAVPSTMGRQSLTVEWAHHKEASLWLDAWRRLKRNKAAVAGLVLILFVAMLAIVAPWVTPYSYDQHDFKHLSEESSREHWLGTDHLGRDVLTRIIFGARISLMVGLVSEIVVLLIGVPLGIMAGYFGSWFDMIVSRIIDVLYAFPDLLFIIIIMTYIKGVLKKVGGEGGILLAVDQATGGLLGIFIGIGLVGWLTTARIVRGQVLSLRERDFIVAARSVGTTTPGIMRRHLLPNSLAPIIIHATFGIPGAMMYEAGLSFLGLGIRPPMPSWGIMISEGITNIMSYPHLLLWPSLALSILMLSFSFLGDGLRDALDPWMK